MIELLSIIKSYLPFFEYLKDGVVITDLDGVITYVNPSLEKMIGQSAKKLIGSHFSGVFSKPDVFAEIRQEVGSKKKTTRKISIHVGDEERSIDICATIVYNERNLPSGLTFIFQQTTSAQIDLSVYEGKLSVLTALDNRSDEVIIISDVVSGKNIFCSKSIERIMGWLPEDFIKGGWAFVASLTHPDDIRLVSDVHGEGMKLRKAEKYTHDHLPIVYVYRKRHKDGSWRWIRTQSFVLDRNKEAEITLAISFLRDITLEKIIGNSLEEDIMRSKVSGGFSTLWSGDSKEISGTILTAREKQVLEEVRNGRSTKHIAAELGLSVPSVNSFRKKLMEKLGARNTAELVRRGYELKIFD